MCSYCAGVVCRPSTVDEKSKNHRKLFLTINSIIMKNNNQMHNDPACCMPGSECCGGITEMGCC